MVARSVRYKRIINLSRFPASVGLLDGYFIISVLREYFLEGYTLDPCLVTLLIFHGKSAYRLPLLLIICKVQGKRYLIA